MHPAVDHVHHGDRQHVCVDAADVAEEGQAQLIGGRLGGGQRHAQDGVGAEAALVGCPVGIDHGQVDGPLVECVESLEDVGDLAVDVGHRVQHALAPVAFATVTQLHRLERPGGGAGGDDGPADRSGVEDDLDLDRGIATGVEDLPAEYLFDEAHCALSLLLAV